MSSILKVNQIVDAGNNSLVKTDGSGTIDFANTRLSNSPMWMVTKNTTQTVNSGQTVNVSFQTNLKMVNTTNEGGIIRGMTAGFYHVGCSLKYTGTSPNETIVGFKNQATIEISRSGTTLRKDPVLVNKSSAMAINSVVEVTNDNQSIRIKFTNDNTTDNFSLDRYEDKAIFWGYKLII